MTEKSRASAGISMRQAYQVSGQPCTSSSGGPSPPVTACRRRSPTSTYRLVNVPVNPAGRFGAPETEPGPSGMGRPVDDELIRIPFHEWHGLTIARRTAYRARDIPWSVTLARQREAIFAAVMADRADWEHATRQQRLCARYCAATTTGHRRVR